jgi:hypothetical protein
MQQTKALCRVMGTVEVTVEAEDVPLVSPHDPE